MVMPSLGGRELAERLASSRPSLKVVFMSGYTREGTLLSDLRGGFLQKPFTLQDLSLRIRELLDRTPPA
jgi:CheY-like chemotaxis protein